MSEKKLSKAARTGLIGQLDTPGADEGSTATFNVRVVDGRIALELPAEELGKAS